MTLERAVVDLRNDFWEHGRLYVAVSRITNPTNLCILLPPSAVKDAEGQEIHEASMEEER
jgi:hypothetical protein